MPDHPVMLEAISAVSQLATSSSRGPHVEAITSAKQRLRGIWVPVVTPFKDGSLDVTALRQLAQQLVNSGVHGLVACSTTGEFGSLTTTEKLTIIEVLLEITDRQIPVLMGLNGFGTADLIQQANMLQQYDIFGFLIAPPPFVKPSQTGLIRHFNLVADSVNKPIVLYNVPSRCGVALELDTLKALAGHPHIIGLKESSGSLHNLVQAIAHTPLNVMCGDDALLLSAMQYGASGAISAAAHIHTDVFVSIYELMHTGQLAAAKKRFKPYEQLIALLFSETNPAPLKALLAHQRLVEAELRLPLSNVSVALEKELVSTFEQLAQGSSTMR